MPPCPACRTAADLTAAECLPSTCALLAKPIKVVEPAAGTSSAFVVSSPHSGNVYPGHFVAASGLNPLALRKSEDCFVDELVAGAAAYGAPVLSANFPRAFCDANREPYELDPKLFREPLPAFATTHTPRVLGGLGTIARVVSETEPIYRDAPTLRDCLTRIERLHFPYHETLARLRDAALAQHGYSVVVDCHSMPSFTVGAASGAWHVILGDRFGAACDTRVTSAFADAFNAEGFTVSLNRPYAGGYITEHHGAPRTSRHAIQIELNRGAYMNETTLQKSSGFTAVAAALTRVFARAFAEVTLRSNRRIPLLAAE